MGIRIHTVMGYGLTDVNVENYNVVDDRFNPEGLVLCDYSTKKETFSFEQFKQHVNDTKNDSESPDLYLTRTAMTGRNPLLNKSNYESLIIYDTEYGLNNVMCFIPPGLVNDWYRDDSIIDYYTSYLLTNSNFINNTTINDGANWCQVMDIPFYPYDGYINKITGERATTISPESTVTVSEVINDLRNVETNYYKQYQKSGGQGEENYNKTKSFFLSEIGCENNWTEKYTPAIPSDLIAFLKFAKVFKDDSTIWQLQPMIYTYWN